MKPTELNSKSLMIEDLVSYNGTPIKVENIHEDCINYSPDIPYVQEEFFIDITDIKPIPLTKEILEKIGFNKVPQQGCLNSYYWMMEKYEEESEELLYRIQAYKTIFRGMYISIDNYADCEQIKISKQIEHFHELQHVLRLCGLNDLADNLKLEE